MREPLSAGKKKKKERLIRLFRKRRWEGKKLVRRKVACQGKTGLTNISNRRSPARNDICAEKMV